MGGAESRTVVQDDRVDRATPEQVERAQLWLAHESAAAAADGSPTAAGRVYVKLCDHFAPLLGHSGVELLLVRSAKLVGGDLAWVAEVSLLQGSARLRESLQAKKS